MGHAERKHINMYAGICEARLPVLGAARIQCYLYNGRKYLIRRILLLPIS